MVTYVSREKFYATHALLRTTNCDLLFGIQVVKIQIPLHSFILSLKIICNSLSHKEALGLVFLYCKTAIMSV